MNLAVVGERLSDLKIGWMIGALVLCFFQLVLLSARWQEVARVCGAHLPFRHAFRLSLIASFFNQVLPSTVGGDAMRIWLLARMGPTLAQASYSVLLDRFVGVLVLALLVLGSMPWSLTLVQNPIGRMALLVIGWGSVAGALAFLALGWLRGTAVERWAPFRHLVQMSVIARELLFNVRTGATVIAVSLAIHALTAGISWCSAKAVGAPFGFFDALQLIPPVMLIATIPISIAGWGVREKSLMLAFAYAGLSANDGFLVSVLLGATLFVAGIVGGIVWLADTAQTSRDADDTPFRNAKI